MVIVVPGVAREGTSSGALGATRRTSGGGSTTPRVEEVEDAKDT